MRPVRIEHKQVPGGTELTAVVRSDRGTLARSASIVVLRANKTAEEYAGARALAIEKLLAKPV